MVHDEREEKWKEDLNSANRSLDKAPPEIFMDDVKLKIDDGALVEVPIFEPDVCGKNWLAVIEGRDKAQPGGLKRKFCPRAGTPFYYVVLDFVERGSVIEFGADRVSLKRPERKQPRRAYGIVREITADLLTYFPQPNPMTALALSISPAFANNGKPRVVRKIREI